MKYKYTTVSQVLNTKGKFTKRPIIEVSLIGSDETKNITAFALIDSGADTTLINSQYADALEIKLDPSKSRPFTGISGDSVKCTISSVEFKVKGFPNTFKTSVGFIDSQSVDILLGQEDFFEIFKIKFEKDHDVFELVEVKK